MSPYMYYENQNEDGGFDDLMRHTGVMPASPSPAPSGFLSPEEWAKYFDVSRLGGSGAAVALDPTRDTTGFLNALVGSEDSLRRFGLGRGDISYAFGGANENDGSGESYYTLSDQAAKQFEGDQVNYHTYDGRRVLALLDRDGQVKYISTPGDKVGGNWLDQVADIAVPLMIGIGTGGLGTALGSAMGLTGAAGTAFTGAVRGLGSSALSGGDMLEGVLRGGISGLLAPTIDSLAASAGKAVGGGDIGNAVSRAVRGASRAALSGGDVGAGALAGGLGSLTSSLLGPLGLPQGVQNTLATTLASSLLGNDPRRAFLSSAVQEILSSGIPTSAPPEDNTDWDAIHAEPSVVPGYVDPDGFYVHETAITPEAQSAYPVQDFGIDAITPDNFASFNRNLRDIYNNRGGFTSQWQTAGSDRIMVQDDGSAIGLNTETGEVYGLEADQTQRMIDAGLLNTETSGYNDAFDTAMTPTAVPSRPTPSRPTPAAPSPSPSPTTSSTTDSGGLDLGALMAIMGAMGGAGSGAASPSEPQVADVGVKSPFGNILDSLGA